MRRPGLLRSVREGSRRDRSIAARIPRIWGIDFGARSRYRKCALLRRTIVEKGEAMKDKKVDKKEAKVGGLDFEVVVLSSSGDLSKKIAEALEKKLEKEGKRA